MTDYSELKRLAENATLGPWMFYEKSYENGPEVFLRPPKKGGCGERIAAANSDSNAEYIAAASPDVVLALIAENEALRKDASGIGG